MDEVVELVAVAVVTVAAAAFSHFGVSVERPEPAPAVESRAVRRSPVVLSGPQPRLASPLVDCDADDIGKSHRTYA